MANEMCPQENLVCISEIRCLYYCEINTNVRLYAIVSDACTAEQIAALGEQVDERCPIGLMPSKWRHQWY